MRRCKYGRRKDGKCRKTTRASAKRKKKCKFGVNKNTGACLKNKRPRRRR